MKKRSHSYCLPQCFSASTRMLHAPPFPKYPVSQVISFATSCLVSSNSQNPISARALLQPSFLLSLILTFKMTSYGLHRLRSALSTLNAKILPLNVNLLISHVQNSSSRPKCQRSNWWLSTVCFFMSNLKVLRPKFQDPYPPFPRNVHFLKSKWTMFVSHFPFPSLKINIHHTSSNYHSSLFQFKFLARFWNPTLESQFWFQISIHAFSLKNANAPPRSGVLIHRSQDILLGPNS